MSGPIEISPNDKKHVLLLDDDKSYLEALTMYLEQSGVEVTAVSSMDEARRQLEQKSFQVVISDIFFEDEQKTGDEFIIENIRLMKEAKVVAVTGFSAHRIKRLDVLSELGVEVIEKGVSHVERIENVIGIERTPEHVSKKVSRPTPSVASPTESKEVISNPYRLRVFLCHSSDDKPSVRALYHRLRDDGIEPWFEEEDLLPGHEWEREIPKAVRSSDFVIVCLSQGAVNKRGYVQKEIRFALDVADELPADTIFIIPLRLEECEVPERLRRWQWVNLFEERGYERLMLALKGRERRLIHSRAK